MVGKLSGGLAMLEAAGGEEEEKEEVVRGRDGEAYPEDGMSTTRFT